MKKRTLFPGRREIRTIVEFEILFLKRKNYSTHFQRWTNQMHTLKGTDKAV